jgi:predicted RNase H-like HicB family nuclease
MIEKTHYEGNAMAGKTLHEMLAEARGYVELFLEDLENDDTIIEEPQEMLYHILASLEYAGRVVGGKGGVPLT